MELKIKFNKLLIVILVTLIAYFNYNVVMMEVPNNVDIYLTVYAWVVKLAPVLYVLLLIIAYIRYSEDPEASVNIQRNVAILMILMTTTVIVYAIFQGVFDYALLGGYIIPFILLQSAVSLKKRLYMGL